MHPPPLCLRLIAPPGLLAASLSNLDYVENQVKGPLLSRVCRYLRVAVLGRKQQPQQHPQHLQRQGAPEGKMAATQLHLPSLFDGKGAGGAAVHSGSPVKGLVDGDGQQGPAGGASSAATGDKPGMEGCAGSAATEGKTGPSDALVASTVRSLRHSRVRYCIQINSRTGEEEWGGAVRGREGRARGSGGQMGGRERRVRGSARSAPGLGVHIREGDMVTCD